jgi:hypothetical protein
MVLDHGQILREIMVVYQSSLVDGEDEEEQAVGFQRILDSMVDPVMEMCSSVSTERRAAKQRWDQEVFVLNCLTFLQVKAFKCVFSVGILMFLSCRACWNHFNLQPKSRGRFRKSSMSEWGYSKTNMYVTLLNFKGVRS